VAQGRTYKRLRKSDIEFLWTQLEDVIEHGKNKDAKRRLKLLQRIYHSPKRGKRTKNKKSAVIKKVDSSLQSMRVACQVEQLI
jgi:hypothetical protein